MQSLKTRALALLAVVAVAACSGSTGPQGPAGQNGTSGTDGATGAQGPAGPAGPAGTNAQTSAVEQCLICHGPNQVVAIADVHGTTFTQQNRDGIKVTDISISGAAQATTDGFITVKFSLKDNSGRPVDVNGVYSQNQKITPRFSLAWFDTDASGIVTPLNVLTTGYSHGALPINPSAFGAPALGTTPDANGTGTFVAGANQGSYVYTFPMTNSPTGTTYTGYQAVAYPLSQPASGSTRTFVLWIEAARQMDLSNSKDGLTFMAVNQPFYFDPNSSTTFVVSPGGSTDPDHNQSPSPNRRELVSMSNCNNCHRYNRPEVDFANKLGPNLNMPTYHGGNRYDGTYCNVCHNPVRQSKSMPWADSKSHVHRIHNSEHLQPANIFDEVEGVTYPQDIRNCAGCHGGAAQGNQIYQNPSLVACGSCHDYVDFTGNPSLKICTDPVTVDANGLPVPCEHVGLAQPDSSKCALCHSPDVIKSEHVPVVAPDPTNCISQKNAAGCNMYTNSGWLPAAGQLPSGAAKITYVVQGVSRNALKQPVIVFKFQNNGADVPFNDPTAKQELMDNFVGSPSVYFAFGVPQDGIDKPADFNATASSSVKNVWNGSATGGSQGTMTGPDANGFYTLTLTGVTVPDNAVMLTGGVGYSYGAALKSLPLTQTNLPAYPYDSTTGYGGLIMPVHDVWAVAAGYTGRRQIVDNAKCLTCHVELGANPTFHAGQRNDGPTCTFCHNANRASSGWALNEKDFIHSLHAGAHRTVPFTYNDGSFTDVTFPGALNDCTACHYPGTFDYSASASAAAVPNLLWSTAASGKYSSTDLSISPYVLTDGTDYGAVFSFNAATGATTPAASTTLVNSPIMAACVACHDDPTMRAHMQQNGGSFYAPRTVMQQQ